MSNNAVIKIKVRKQTERFANTLNRAHDRISSYAEVVGTYSRPKLRLISDGKNQTRVL